jgi:predicted HTH domain antitoxin
LSKGVTRQVVAARLPRELAREIERIAAEEKLDKSTVVARATGLYVKQWKLERAIALYDEGKVTAMKAAGLAGLSIWELLEELERRKIPVRYTAEQFREDFEAARKG